MTTKAFCMVLVAASLFVILAFSPLGHRMIDRAYENACNHQC